MNGEQAAGVLNGIAWDDEHERLFVTGKDWPSLYEVEMVGCPELRLFWDHFESGALDRDCGNHRRLQSGRTVVLLHQRLANGVDGLPPCEDHDAATQSCAGNLCAGHARHRSRDVDHLVRHA